METKTSRSCGDCYACCIWLGIQSLNKPTGKTCKHLENPKSACERCSIYENRPRACQTYQCGWLIGLGSNDLRPRDSGMLFSFYDANKINTRSNKPFAQWCGTLTIFDQKLSGEFKDKSSKLSLFVNQILESTENKDFELRVYNFYTKKVLRFFEGKIYSGEAIPSKGIEDLNFFCYEKPIGYFHLEDREPKVEIP